MYCRAEVGRSRDSRLLARRSLPSSVMR